MASLFAPLLRRFGARFDYDVDYLERMDRQAPGTLWRWLLLSPLNSYTGGVPPATRYAANLVATHAADCGPCLRLVINMASAAGVPKAQLAAALTDDRARMDEDTALGADYARAVLAREEPAAAVLRERLVARFGERALPPLALAIAFGGFYPTLKRGLGAASSCAPVLAELQAAA